METNHTSQWIAIEGTLRNGRGTKDQEKTEAKEHGGGTHSHVISVRGRVWGYWIAGVSQCIALPVEVHFLAQHTPKKKGHDGSAMLTKKL